MRRAGLIILVSMAAGCASAHPCKSCATRPTTTAALEARDAHVYRYPASALAFEPPVARYAPPMDLSRKGRETQAFAGFDQAYTTFYYSLTSDRQSTDFSNSYDRWTVSQQVGTSSR